MGLTEENLVQIEKHIYEILPELIARNPKIATTIEGILAQHFPRRDELAQMLNEFRDFRAETAQRFDTIEGRLDTIDGRLDTIDGRLDTIDERLDKVDERFDKVDERFAKVDERFDKVDERFDKVDERFDKVDKTILGMRRDIIKLQSGQDNLAKQFDGHTQWIKLMVGGLGNTEGSMAEDLVAAALRYGLKNQDIAPESLKLRQLITDPDGKVFSKGYRSEVDIIATNAHLTIFEVKAHRVKPGDVAVFALKIKLFTLENPGVPVEGLLIVPGALPHVEAECLQYGIELVS